MILVRVDISAILVVVLVFSSHSLAMIPAARFQYVIQRLKSYCEDGERQGLLKCNRNERGSLEMSKTIYGNPLWRLSATLYNNPNISGYYLYRNCPIELPKTHASFMKNCEWLNPLVRPEITIGIRIGRKTSKSWFQELERIILGTPKVKHHTSERRRTRLVASKAINTYPLTLPIIDIINIESGKPNILTLKTIIFEEHENVMTGRELLYTISQQIQILSENYISRIRKTINSLQDHYSGHQTEVKDKELKETLLDTVSDWRIEAALRLRMLVVYIREKLQYLERFRQSSLIHCDFHDESVHLFVRSFNVTKIEDIKAVNEATAKAEIYPFYPGDFRYPVLTCRPEETQILLLKANITTIYAAIIDNLHMRAVNFHSSREITSERIASAGGAHYVTEPCREKIDDITQIYSFQSTLVKLVDNMKFFIDSKISAISTDYDDLLLEKRLPESINATFLTMGNYIQWIAKKGLYQECPQYYSSKLCYSKFAKEFTNFFRSTQQIESLATVKQDICNLETLDDAIPACIDFFTRVSAEIRDQWLPN